MKVKDLLTKLSVCNPEAEVGVSNFALDGSILSVDCVLTQDKVVALDTSSFDLIHNTTEGAHGAWHYKDFKKA